MTGVQGGPGEDPHAVPGGEPELVTGTAAESDLPLPSPPTSLPSPPKDDPADRRVPRHQAREELEDRLHQAREDIEDRLHQARGQFDQANEKIKQRTGRDLIGAILIGVLAGAVLIGSLIFLKWTFVPIAVALAVLAVIELARALRGGGRRIDLIPQLVGAVGIVLAGYFAELWLFWFALFAAVALVIVWRLIAQMAAQDGRLHGDILYDVVAGGFIQAYVPFFAGLALVLLRQEGGEWWVIAFIAVVVAADTGAYAAGLSFGKHPMAPRISPKKTWEGFGGAVAAAVLVGVLLALFLLHLPWWAGPIIGIAVLITATLGDLAESMLKRDLGIKDMSSWVPGHGGLLDRLDSILPSTVAAVALYFLLTPWTVS